MDLKKHKEIINNLIGTSSSFTDEERNMYHKIISDISTSAEISRTINTISYIPQEYIERNVYSIDVDK